MSAPVPSTRDSVNAILEAMLGGDAVAIEAFQRLNVLIVEPNRHTRLLVKGMMRSFGFRNFHEVDDTAAALQCMREHPIDLVLTEFQVSPADGISFVHVLRRGSDSPNRLVPVVMYTDRTTRGIVLAARDAGIDEFVVKPLSAEALLARVHAAVLERRPFVRSKVYFGPDRRRHKVPPPDNLNRRHVRPQLFVPPSRAAPR